ncbi:MAG TPA: hypothetical protein VFQ87_19440 [Bradyrhizobium sp.]|jgi:hypothetical protein|nr:hypothetical protein [Bradyrhizobium sp.]
MADAATTSWFLTVVSLVAGYGLKSITDLVQHKWNVEKEREARKAARQDQRFQRRSAFQRETLLALQDACMDLGRATAQANSLNLAEFRASKTWNRRRLPDDLDESHRLAQARTQLLLVRVRDASVRQLAANLRELSAETLLGRSADDSEHALASMGLVFESLNNRIGELLREIDDDDAPA